MLLSLVAATLFAAPAADASSSSRTLIALGVTSKTLTPEVRAALSQVVSDELRRLEPGVRLYAAEDLAVALGVARERRLAGCESESESTCLTEFAAALGSDELLSTRITRLSGGPFSSPWLVDARKVDGKTGRTLSTGQVTVCGPESELPAAVRAAVWKAWGLEPRGVAAACTPQLAPRVLAVGGGVLLLAGVAGLAVSMGTRAAYDAQQVPGAPATVTRAQGTAANTLFALSLGAGAVGALGVGLGLAGLLGSSDTKVAVAPLPGGAAVTWGGAL